MVHWNETQGNKFLQKPDERFFTQKFLKREETVTVYRNVSIKGESKLKSMRLDATTERNELGLVPVEYDRGYLISYITYWLKPFLSLPWITLSGLVKEAFKLANEEHQ